MKKPIVNAVVRATIEIPVRSSSSEETMSQLYEAAKREAEDIIRTKLGREFRLVGQVEFAYAVVRELE